MGTISYFDIWKTYENETMNDEDLLRFAKGLFQEGFIRVSTVYDEELDKNVTRYDINASKIIKPELAQIKQSDIKPTESTPEVKMIIGSQKMFNQNEIIVCEFLY